MVAAGLRPEQRSDSLSQELTDELWEHIVACWNDEPNERPTAIEVLRTLGEAEHWEDVEDSDEETGVRDPEWNFETDGREQSTLSG